MLEATLGGGISSSYDRVAVGIASTTTSSTSYLGQSGVAVGFWNKGDIYRSTGTGATNIVSGRAISLESDIIGIAFDCGTGGYWFRKNGAWVGGDPGAGDPGAGDPGAGDPIYVNFDGVDDDLVATFPASLGAGCTVCRSLPGTGASITTGVTLTDTYTDNVDAHALLIYTAAQWAALDAGQIANITKWLNGRAGL